MKMLPRMTSTLACSALALVLCAPGVYSADAQQSEPMQPVQHLASSAMSPADAAAFQARQRELIEAARIYGYSLEEGSWSYEQTLCASMPDTILLHYRRDFSDGSESLLTALVPRSTGRVRIVPILYHNASPFVPAPKNPRNFALFNDLVPQSIARKAIALGGDWLQLSACYADMTGAPTGISPSYGTNATTVDVPQATAHVDAQNSIVAVDFSTAAAGNAYSLWSISFNKNGRIVGVNIEAQTYYAASKVSPSQPAVPASAPVPPAETTQPVASAAINGAEATSPPETSSQPTPASSQPTPVGTVAATEGKSENISEPALGPGWKVVPPAPEPVWKMVPEGPAPKVKIIPMPPDSSGQSSSADQSPQ